MALQQSLGSTAGPVTEQLSGGYREKAVDYRQAASEAIALFDRAWQGKK